MSNDSRLMALESSVGKLSEDVAVMKNNWKIMGFIIGATFTASIATLISVLVYRI